MFKKASKSSAKLRLGLIGPPGGGKTWTALSIAEGLGGKVALLDTENSSASKYADRFDFDTVSISECAPRTYVSAIKAAASGGYNVLIIDSLSHAWAGKGGALEMADNAAKRSKSGNSFAAWRDVTPEHNALVDAMIQSPIHIIATLRTKVEYVQEKDPVTGKNVVKKLGLAPITGKGLEYEFDIVMDMDDAGKALVTKTRYRKWANKAFTEPGPEFGKELAVWLSDGSPAQEKSPVQETALPTSEIEKFTFLISTATNSYTLKAIGKEIRKAADYGQITDQELIRLSTEYKKKESHLAS